MHTSPPRRPAGLAALLPSLLLLAVLGGAATTTSAADRAPVVDLTVTRGR